MLQRLLLLTAAALFCAFQTQAQAYEPGLLVRSGGDTLRGEIENRFWVEPPAFIRFRSTAGGPDQLFQPRQLRTVSFTNGRYFRYLALSLDHGAETRLDLLPSNNATDVRTDSVLTEVLVDGVAQLLRVVLPGAAHYLVQRPSQPGLDLSERHYLSNGLRARLVNGNNYRGQLGVYFGDCPAAHDAAQKAVFTAEGLAAVVQAYNTTCSATQQTGRTYLAQASPRRRMALLGGVLAGARYNYLEGYYAPKTCIDCQLRPFGGLYADLFMPGRAVAIYGELSSTPVRSQGLQLASFTYNSFTYRAWLHTARVGVRFFFSLPHERQWLLGLGYELSTLTNRSGAPTGGPPAVLLEELATYQNPTALPWLALGWRARRVTLSLDGQFYLAPKENTVLVGSNYSVRLGVAYRLGRSPDATSPSAPARP